MTVAWKGGATSRTARNAQALHLSRRLGIPAEEVLARWRDGHVWNDDLGWTTIKDRVAHRAAKRAEAARKAKRTKP